MGVSKSDETTVVEFHLFGFEGDPIAVKYNEPTRQDRIIKNLRWIPLLLMLPALVP